MSHEMQATPTDQRPNPLTALLLYAPNAASVSRGRRDVADRVRAWGQRTVPQTRNRWLANYSPTRCGMRTAALTSRCACQCAATSWRSPWATRHPMFRRRDNQTWTARPAAGSTWWSPTATSGGATDTPPARSCGPGGGYELHAQLPHFPAGARGRGSARRHCRMHNAGAAAGLGMGAMDRSASAGPAGSGTAPSRLDLAKAVRREPASFESVLGTGAALRRNHSSGAWWRSRVVVREGRWRLSRLVPRS